MPLPAETIRAKRDGRALSVAQIEGFVRGLVDRHWSEGQAAALAMAILLKGMTRAECVALTRAMANSGQVLDWSRAGLPGPVVDKHSTGGVGDKVSLVLAPIVAACGAVVPMISGRGLGHTGGTLDKLQSLAGYEIAPTRATFRRVLRDAGCAIVGASGRLAPADRRLYAIRDVTATVESVPLITASILSKKIAAGLQFLVMDVKAGNGAFCPTVAAARELAGNLVAVAATAGLPTRALVTDMNQVLGRTAGNALEMREAIDFLTGDAPREPRLEAVTLALAGEMLAITQLAPDPRAGERLARAALASGAAADRFARMVRGLGGPSNVGSPRFAGLPCTRHVIEVRAPNAGWLVAMDTRALGIVVVELGGGRAHASDPIDPRVGLSNVLPLGTRVARGEPLMRVHAASMARAEAAAARAAAALVIAGSPGAAAPVILDRVAAG
ncbi:MAG: thymidine phosphorylase [Aquincola sp.]|nr:thymidine phosphorylase [Aquincola sp.]MDH4288466.1 thymidine phosphorylase [Aquincola sp.]MDH5329960.1 thymidine phosphorylase [Aquincola sp.]